MSEFDLRGPLPTGTAVLEASAGTGKTYTIAALTARYIAEGRRLDEMMIVTFSRMATVELRARVRERLELCQGALAHVIRTGELPERADEVVRLLAEGDAATVTLRQERLCDALAEFDTATIATTHEFSHRMLQSLGTLADHVPAPVFTEDLTRLAEESARDRYVASYASEERRPFPLETALALAREAVRKIDTGLAPELLGEQRQPWQVRERLRFTAGVRADVEERKRRRSLVTYDDMVSGLRDALRHPIQGKAARDRLAARFPVVLIDEFQDTDPVQWEIVQLAFVGRSTVVLIGDPKQAIYGFRGAEVHTYLAARRTAETQDSLGTNYRSDKPLIEAIDALLGGAALGHPEIVATQVKSAHSGSRLHLPEPWEAPMRIRYLPGAGNAEPLPIREIRPLVRRDLVNDIKRLLEHPQSFIELDRERRHVRPQDIAVLVSTNEEGRAIMEALIDAGVPAVFPGVSSVYKSQAAHDWLTLLVALDDPTPWNIRAAALTSLVGWKLVHLVEVSAEALTQLGARLRGWATVWHEHGVAALAEAVASDGIDGSDGELHGLAARVLSRRDGDRLLTDLRHVAENLQAAAARDHLGPAGLIAWLRANIEQAALKHEEDRSRRLDTDEPAVMILTIHRSKGLEFPLVYLPQAADRWVYEKDKVGNPYTFHDGNGVRHLDVGGPHTPTSRERYEAHLADDAGESLRQLYVGLTRAQCQVTCWWIPTKSIHLGYSPLQRLLFRDQNSPEPSPFCEGLDPASLPHLHGHGIAFQPMELELPRRSTPPSPDIHDLHVRPWTREIDTTWRRTSYSGLTAGVHDSTALELDTREPDEPVDEPLTTDAPIVETAPDSAPNNDVLAQPSQWQALGGGVEFGSLIHAIFEEIDPTAPNLQSELLNRAGYWLKRWSIPGATPEALATALMATIQTSLGPIADGLTLADISPRDRLTELEFDLPLDTAPGHRPATLADVADLLAAYLDPTDPLAAYPEALRTPGLGGETLHGFLTGSIDALLRISGPTGEPRYLVVDYKTNRIGPPGEELPLRSFTHASMALEMVRSHYPLQALLYCVATHRFLRWRQDHYDPATHLGGTAYLFVRGMAGVIEPGRNGSLGVFDWKPPPTLVMALSDLLAHGLPQACSGVTHG